MNALDFAIKLFGELPGLISAGANVVSLITTYRDKLAEMSAQNRAPTQQEWDELNQRITDLRKQLHAP